MKVDNIFGLARKVVERNAPAVLTGVGVVGTVATAYLAGQASFKAADVIAKAQTERVVKHEDPLDTKTKVKLVWINYIPAVGVGVGTIAAIIYANRINAQRAAAIAAAYAISEKKFSEYRDKVLEEMGVSKEQKLRDEVNEDRVNNSSADQQITIITEDGNVQCFDTWSGRYFMSSMEAMKEAMNKVNYEILHNNYSSLSDFYNRLGLYPTKESDNLGWNSDRMLDIFFTTTVADNKKPCLVMDFNVDPFPLYYKTH